MAVILSSISSWVKGTLHGTPRSMLHRPVTGSGGARLMKGGSSRKPTVRWNFSGTPWEAQKKHSEISVCLFTRPDGHFQTHHTPIYCIPHGGNRASFTVQNTRVHHESFVCFMSGTNRCDQGYVWSGIRCFHRYIGSSIVLQ